MVKCVRGFIKFQKSYGWQRAVKVFTEKAAAQGDKVVKIINAYPVGDNVFCVLANVEMKED